MTKSEKQARLDQFETREQFGIWPDYKLIKRARQASEALFRFDTLCAGSCWLDKAHGGRELNLHIDWKNPDGTPANFREGVPRGDWRKIIWDNLEKINRESENRKG